MQLTSPLFLFLFLPLSVVLLLPVPPRHRAAALAVISMLWYVLANRDNPAGLLHMLLLLLFSYVLSLRRGRYGRVRCAVATLVPLLTLLATRILAEQGALPYAFPAGLTFPTLGAVSLALDRARGEAEPPRSVLDLFGYLLFFPTLTLGPIIRWRDYHGLTAHMEITAEKLSRGAQLYMLGFVKRLAIAAPILFSADRILSRAGGGLSFGIAVFLLLLSVFWFYFLVTGTSDMARGTALLFGISLPRETGRLRPCSRPSRFLFAPLLSLWRYLLDYVGTPLLRRLGGRRGRVLAAVLLWALTVLFFSTRPVVFLFATPFLALTVLAALRGRELPVPRRRLPRVAMGALSCLLTLLCGALFSFALLAEDPLLLARISGAGEATHLSYYILGTVPISGYLPLGTAAAVVLLPFSRYAALLQRRLGPRAGTALTLCRTVLLFAAFVLTAIYFMPQFPAYADRGLLRLIL